MSSATAPRRYYAPNPDDVLDVIRLEGTCSLVAICQALESDTMWVAWDHVSRVLAELIDHDEVVSLSTTSDSGRSVLYRAAP